MNHYAVASAHRMVRQVVSGMSLRERFGQLFDVAGQMFWEIDRNFRVVYANRLMIETFGDPIGLTCHEFMDRSAESCLECPVRKVFEGAERAVSERKRHDLKGNAIWLRHTAIPIKNDEGEVIGACELTVDMTQRVQMEEWLKDSESMYRSLVEEVPDVIFSLDADCRFSFVNTEVENLLGLPVSSVLETPLIDYVVAEDRPSIARILDLKPDTIWDEEVGILDAQGERRFARIRCKASFHDSGQPSGFEGVMRDRTVRRRLEEELKASKAAMAEKIKTIDELYEHIVESGKRKAIAQHTAEVAHELRQPMAIVGGFAKRIEKQLQNGHPFDLDEHRKYARIIANETERLEKILDRLVAWTKTESIYLERVDPNELVEYILRIADGRIKEKGISVEVNIGPEVEEIPLDPGRFQQLVLNLLANAVEASPVGGRIQVTTGASLPSDKALKVGDFLFESYFELKIRNRGAAIPAGLIEQVFNPFYTTKPQGSGLGLTVAKKIVDDHRGSISVISNEEWTTFTIWLPLADPGIRPPNHLFV
ncbi:MAG: PAS domain-containing protein [Thermodesulfobacteriota bacterium]